MKIEVTQEIAAPPERVWALVSDVTRMGEWSPETIRAVWLDGASAAVAGARFKGTNKLKVARWSTTCTVTEAEPGRSFAFRVGKGPTTWGYHLVATATGCEVTETAEIPDDIGLAEKVLFRLGGVQDRTADLRAAMGRTLERIKAAAEAAP